MDLQQYVYYDKTAELYPDESTTENAVTITNPHTNEVMHVDPSHCKFFYRNRSKIFIKKTRCR